MSKELQNGPKLWEQKHTSSFDTDLGGYLWTAFINSIGRRHSTIEDNLWIHLRHNAEHKELMECLYCLKEELSK